MEKFTINPDTGRKIKVGGVVYNKLLLTNPSIKRQKTFQGKAPSKRLHGRTSSLREIQQLKKTSIRTISAKGWGSVAPKRGVERNELYKKCGDKCFLMPETKNFPICRKLSASSNRCEIDCTGIAAAKIRSHQWKYRQVGNKIDKIQSSYCSR